MRAFFKQIAFAFLLVLAVAYGYDSASVRRRMSAKKPGDPFDVTLPTRTFLRFPKKGTKWSTHWTRSRPWNPSLASTRCFLTSGTRHAGTFSAAPKHPRK